VEPVSIEGLMNFSARYELFAGRHVARPLRALVRAYVRWLPKPLLGTGFNPWVAALIKKDY
jgi:hypothetical protein